MKRKTKPDLPQADEFAKAHLAAIDEALRDHLAQESSFVQKDEVKPGWFAALDLACSCRVFEAASRHDAKLEAPTAEVYGPFKTFARAKRFLTVMLENKRLVVKFNLSQVKKQRKPKEAI